MTENNCFPAESLKNYLVGELDDSLAVDIEQHLADCPVCEQTIVDLENESDTILELLRYKKVSQGSEPAEPIPEPSVFVRAFDNAKQLIVDSANDEGGRDRLSRWLPQSSDFGSYELLKPLGRGGMATVFLARHRQLGKQVAIKILPATIGNQQQPALRFQREIRAAGCLNHPSIVLATDAGDLDGLHYLVMEYIDGLDLSQLARTVGPLKIADACELCRQVALGLSHAHAAGIVHRDIKPSNLMLDMVGRAKILDFGLAQLSLWDEASAELTTVGQLMGTLDYMAPEQAERSGSVDYRADLYSLGATLFRLLCGRAPLAASPNLSPLEKLRLLASHEPPRLDTLRPDAPPELVELVGDLLARSIDNRPASAAHVAERLASLAESADLVELARAGKESQANAEKTAVRPSEPMRLAATNQLVSVSSSPSAISKNREPPKSRWRLWMIAAVFVPLFVYAGVLVVLETQKGQLVIDSEVADVQVTLHQDGRPDREITLQPGNTTTKLYAGKYEVTIAGASDSITLENGKFEIRKGETIIARVEQKKIENLQPGKSNAELNQSAIDSELVFEGKTLTEWLAQVKRERSPEALGQSLAAIESLVTSKTSKQITDLLVEMLHELKGDVVFYSVFSSLSACNPGSAYGELLTRILETSDSQLQARLITYGLDLPYAQVQPVLKWLEENVVRGSRTLSNDANQILLEVLRRYCQSDRSSIDIEERAAHAIRILGQWKVADGDFWLSRNLERGDGLKAKFREEVIRQAAQTILDQSSNSAYVVQAAMIIRSTTDKDVETLGSATIYSLKVALANRLGALATDPPRMLGLTKPHSQNGFDSFPKSRSLPVKISFIQSTAPQYENAYGYVSEAIVFLEAAERLNIAHQSGDLFLAAEKSLLGTTQTQSRRFIDRIKDMGMRPSSLGIGWPNVSVVTVTGVSAANSNNSVQINTGTLPTDEVLGFLIHISAAGLGGGKLDDPWRDLPKSTPNRVLGTAPAGSAGISPAAVRSLGGGVSDSNTENRTSKIGIAGVEQKNLQSSKLKAELSPTAIDSELLYDGKTLTEWLAQLKRERSPEAIGHSLAAIRSLVSPQTYKLVTDVLIGMLPDLNGGILVPHEKNDTDIGGWRPMDTKIFGILRTSNPDNGYGELLVKLLDSDSKPMHMRVIKVGLGTDLSRMKPVFEWLEKSVLPGKRILSDVARRELVAVLAVWAKDMDRILAANKSIADYRELCDYPMKILKAWSSAGIEIWLSEPIPEELTAWSSAYRTEVLLRAEETLCNLESQPALVAQAAMILTQLPPALFFKIDDERRERLSAAINARFVALAKDPARLLNLSQVESGFQRHVLPRHLKIQGFEMDFSNQFEFSRSSNVALFGSETIELLEFAARMMRSQFANQAVEIQTKSIAEATASEYSRVVDVFKGVKASLIRLVVAWPVLKTSEVSAHGGASGNEKVFAVASEFTPGEILGFAIHILVLGLQESAPETPLQNSTSQLSNQNSAGPVSSGVIASQSRSTAPELTYEGKRFSEWLNVVKYERSSKTRLAAIEAVRALVARDASPSVSSEMLEILRSPTATNLVFDALVLAVLAKVNGDEKFGKLLTKEMEANEALAMRIFAALAFSMTQPNMNVAFDSVLDWLAKSPIPQKYSKDTVNQLGTFIANVLNSPGTSAAARKKIGDFVLRHPDLGPAHLISQYLSAFDRPDWRTSGATIWDGDSLNRIRQLSMELIDDLNASPLSATIACTALSTFPKTEIDVSHLQESIRKRLQWLSKHPERLHEDLFNESGTSIIDLRVSSIPKQFVRVVFPIGFAVGSRDESPIQANVWKDAAEILAVLALAKRHSLVEKLSREFQEIQTQIRSGHDEVVKLLAEANLESHLPKIAWPFRESDSATLPSELRTVPQKSWKAFVVYELIDNATKAPEDPSMLKGEIEIRQSDIEWATRTLSKYDKNKDGVLQSDETKVMIIKPTGADTNGDGLVSLEEFVRFRSKK